MIESLVTELSQVLNGAVTIVGVGNVLRGDDGVGPLIARLLTEQKSVWTDKGVRFEVIDAGTSPELETWRIREAAPETVLFVDAVDFGGAPGDVALLGVDNMRAEGFDTHKAPLKLTMQYLENEIGCTCRVLAIQPKDVRMGSRMCPEVSNSAELIATLIANIINQR
ncbi:MAG: hydrogenase 3 maturation endopeptidase HyCI [Armatimonadota bacterium]